MTNFAPSLPHSWQKSFLFCGLVIAISLTLVHIHVTAQGADYAGFLLVLDHVFNILIVLALLCLCSAVGFWMLACFRYEFDNSLEALLFSLAIGCGVVSVSILVLGLLSGLRPMILAGLLSLWAFLAKNHTLNVLRLVTRASIEVKEQSNLLSLTVLGIVVAFVISQALLPPRDWDSLMYHLRVPAQFLEAGKIYLPDDNVNTAYVQLVHMLYIPLLAARSLAGPALLSGFLALLLGLAISALSSRFFDRLTAVFSSTLIWATPMILLVAITPRVDVTLAYYLLLAHFALLKARSDWKSFYLSGCIFGLAVGIKLTALLYIAGSGPLIGWVAFKHKNRLVFLVPYLLSFGFLIFLGAIPWLIKNWLLFKAPLYPYFAQVGADGWFASLYPGQNLPQSVDAVGWTTLTQIQSQFNFRDLITSPGNLAPESEAIFYTTSPLFIALCFWAVSDVRKFDLTWLLIPAVCYFIGLITLSPITNLRYFTPVIAPFTIAAVHLMSSRLSNLFDQKRALAVFQLIAVMMLVPAARAPVMWTINRQNLSYLTGGVSRENYLFSAWGYSEYARTVAYVNHHLSPSSRVLMLYEARGFYIKVPVIQDNTLTNWLVLQGRPPPSHCFNQTGISHVLFSPVALDYYLKRGLKPETVKLEQFHDFLKECLVIVDRGSGYVLYESRKLANE